MKPRVWNIPLKVLDANNGMGLSAWVRQDREDETLVIEKIAYDSLLAEAKKLRWALGSYPYVDLDKTMADFDQFLSSLEGR